VRLGSRPHQAAPHWGDPAAALAGIPGRVLAISTPLGTAVYRPHCWPFFVCCISGSRRRSGILGRTRRRHHRRIRNHACCDRRRLNLGKPDLSGSLSQPMHGRRAARQQQPQRTLPPAQCTRTAVTVAELTNKRSAASTAAMSSPMDSRNRKQPMFCALTRVARCQLPSVRSIASGIHRLAVLKALRPRAQG